MKKKTRRSSAAALAALAHAPAAPPKIDPSAPRATVPASSFIVAVEGFQIVGFDRCSMLDTSKNEITIVRSIAAGDVEISNWWNKKEARRVTLFVLGPDNKPIRNFPIGLCVPKSYAVGPFDRSCSDAIEERLTIESLPTPTAPAPTKDRADA